MDEKIETERWCDHCEKETPHDVYDQGRAGTLRICQVCKWFSLCGGDYQPPTANEE